MATYRIHRTRDYTTMSTRHLRDARLSLRAKGMLTILLTLPDDFPYSVSGLMTLTGEGRTVVRSALAELKRVGYVSVSKSKDAETGLFEYEYDVYETTPEPIEDGIDEPRVVESQSSLDDVAQESADRAQAKQQKQKSDRALMDDVIAERTDNPELREVIGEFIRMRARIKRPLTPHALKLRLNTLWKLGKTDEERIKIVNQSVGSSWQDFYALKDEGHVQRRLDLSDYDIAGTEYVPGETGGDEDIDF